MSEYCLIASGIPYYRKPGHVTEDQRNRFDRDETVQRIEKHNLEYDAVCSNRQ